MVTDTNTEGARLLTPAELAIFIKLFRETRQWSQEQLADISRVNVRTIQRIEQGVASSLDTRRAIARAFEFEDIDALNKPFAIPTEEELRAEKEKFDRENVTLTAIPLTSGRQLATLAESCAMDLTEPGFELSREAEEAFAVLVDYFRDYRDCAPDYSQTMKLDVYDEMQSLIDTLKSLGVSLRYAERRIAVKWGGAPDEKPMPVRVVYVIGFPLGREPEKFSVPKNGTVSL